MLSKDQVREILAELERGVKGIDLAKKYGVSSAAITRIKNGELHTDIPRNTQFEQEKNKLTEDDVWVIKFRIKCEESDKQIAEFYNVNTQVISNIRTGRTWKHVHQEYSPIF